MSDNNKLKMLGNEIKECIRTKWIGCFVALAAVALGLVQVIVYAFVSTQDRSTNAIIFSVLAIVSFLVLSLFKKTSPLAPVALMVFDFLALLGFGSAIIDYYSTEFFGGFSIGAFFKQDFVYWYSALSFVLTMLISFVAMYLPQNRKECENKEVEGNENEKV